MGPGKGGALCREGWSSCTVSAGVYVNHFKQSEHTSASATANYCEQTSRSSEHDLGFALVNVMVE